VDRSAGSGPPIFRVVQLERNEHLEIEAMPKASMASVIRLWCGSYLVYAVDSSLLVYDYRDKELKATITGHRAEIVAVDTQDPEILATLARDASVKLWNGRTGQCMTTVHFPDAHYFMEYPYCLSVSGHRILVSADEGVFLTELEQTPAETRRHLPRWVEVQERGKIEMKGKGQVTTYLFRGASRQAELSRELERSHVHFGGLAPVERPGFAVFTSGHLTQLWLCDVSADDFGKQAL
ncbi:FBXW7, partial [Symbiodinium necroappetens]